MKQSKQLIRFRLAGDGKICVAIGRNAWALDALIKAGTTGVTPIDNPAPRWSAYVHKLRTECGLEIETLHEPHGGDYPGTHARYVLKTRIEVVE